MRLLPFYSRHSFVQFILIVILSSFTFLSLMILHSRPLGLAAVSACASPAHSCGSLGASAALRALRARTVFCVRSGASGRALLSWRALASGSSQCARSACLALRSLCARWCVQARFSNGSFRSGGAASAARSLASDLVLRVAALLAGQSGLPKRPKWSGRSRLSGWSGISVTSRMSGLALRSRMTLRTGTANRTRLALGAGWTIEAEIIDSRSLLINLAPLTIRIAALPGSHPTRPCRFVRALRRCLPCPAYPALRVVQADPRDNGWLARSGNLIKNEYFGAKCAA